MEKAKPVINETRDEVRLGDLVLMYDRENEQLDAERRSRIDDGLRFRLADGEDFPPELWESFVKDLEDKVATGLPLATLQRIREMGRDAKRMKSQEERGERGSKALRPGVEAFMQFGIRVEALVNQVLDEFERTSPYKEDESHVSMLDASTSPRGVAPPEVITALNDQAASISAQVTPLNWQVTELGDTRIIFLIYAYSDGERKGIRFAVQINGKTDSSGVIA